MNKSLLGALGAIAFMAVLLAVRRQFGFGWMLAIIAAVVGLFAYALLNIRA